MQIEDKRKLREFHSNILKEVLNDKQEEGSFEDGFNFGAFFFTYALFNEFKKCFKPDQVQKLENIYEYFSARA